MKPTSSVLTTVLFSHTLFQAHPLSIVPKSSPSRHSKLFAPTTLPHRYGPAPLRAHVFAPAPWNFPRLPDLLPKNRYSPNRKDVGVSLLSLEGGSTDNNERVMEVVNVMAGDTSEVDEALASEIHSLSQTFSDLRSSIDTKSNLYEETLKSYQDRVHTLQEENSFLEEGMRMLTVALEERTDEMQQLHSCMVDENVVKKLEDENEMLRMRIRALEVELSDVAFESRKITEVDKSFLEAASKEDIVKDALVIESSVGEVIDLTPKAPVAPVPQHVRQQRELEQLQKQLQVYEEERSSLRKLVGLCFRRGMKKVGMAVNLWRPVYLLLVDARRGGVIA